LRRGRHGRRDLGSRERREVTPSACAVGGAGQAAAGVCRCGAGAEEVKC